MKRLALLLVFVFGLIASSVRAEEEISFDFFYDALAPMGEWAEVDGYGYVWHPADVDADWAPYTDGYWSYTDAGWTWVSYEDWGGITYHYGRWVLLDDYGWCWVPQYEWGPAWVSWRQSEDYVGWAPLPPEAAWEPEVGIGTWVDTSYDIGPGYFSFCHVRDFGAPVLRHVIVSRARNVTICYETRNITRISYNSDFGCVFNGGFDYDYILPRCERPIPALRLVFNTTNVFIRGDRHRIFLNGPRGNALVVGHPRRAEKDFEHFSHRDLVKKTFDKSRVSRGWNRKDKEQEAVGARLQAKMREETKGVTRQNSPVRPIRQAALTKALPEKVDFKARPVALQKVAEREKPGNTGIVPNGPRRGGVAVEDDPRDAQNGRGNRPDVVNKKPGTNENVPENGNPRVRPGTDRDGDGRSDGPGRGPGRVVVKPDGAPENPNRPDTAVTPVNPNTPKNDNPRVRPGTDRDGDGRSDGPGRGPGRVVVKPDSTPENPNRPDTAVTPANPNTPKNDNPRVRPGADRDGDGRSDGPGRGPGRVVVKPDSTPENPNRPDTAVTPTNPNTPGRRTPNAEKPGRETPAVRPGGPRGADADVEPANDNRERNRLIKERETQRDAAEAQRRAAEQAEAARKNGADDAARAAATRKQQQDEAARKNAENASEAQRRQAEARDQAADAAKARSAEMQRQQADAARQRAAETNKERAAEAQRKQQDSARQQQDAARERAAQANKERAAEMQRQQQDAARERAADANRERAAAAQKAQQDAARERAEAQREQQQNAARDRAAAAQRAQQDAARERAADAARERAEAQRAQQAEAGQRAAAAAQAEARQRAAEAAKQKDDDDKKNRRR
jgi:hypothetical protein